MDMYKTEVTRGENTAADDDADDDIKVVVFVVAEARLVVATVSSLPSSLLVKFVVVGTSDKSAVSLSLILLVEAESPVLPIDRATVVDVSLALRVVVTGRADEARNDCGEKAAAEACE
jgi:hypothetical protein